MASLQGSVKQLLLLTVVCGVYVVTQFVYLTNYQYVESSTKNLDSFKVVNFPSWNIPRFVSTQTLKPSVVSSDPCLNVNYSKPDDFEGFDNEVGEPNGCNIIPNYIHFVKFGQKTFNFPHTVCILAALKNQKPDKIFFHTDVSKFKGKYWDILLATPGFKEKLVIKYVPVPTEIFGQPIRKGWLPYHGGDVTRLRVLIKYGGIYLDNDSYIVKNLDYFRRFEMSLGWKPGRSLGNMVIIAHKNARFLHKWLDSYNGNYHRKKFYYNAGYYPAFHILKKNPYLIHREEKYFGNYGPFKNLYLEPFPEWKNYYAIHTQSNHLIQLKSNSKGLKYPVKFNEKNIYDYPIAFRDMVLSVYPENIDINDTLQKN